MGVHVDYRTPRYSFAEENMRNMRKTPTVSSGTAQFISSDVDLCDPLSLCNSVYGNVISLVIVVVVVVGFSSTLSIAL